MKKIQFNTTISALALVLMSSAVQAETAAEIGILPSQKIPTTVNEGDRNPFATRIAMTEDVLGNFDSESEESRIRQIFAGLTVNGRVPGGAGAGRVLVGDLILEEGEVIPQVIENQTNVLKVTKISDKEVEITWIDEELAEAPRKLLIPVNLEPKVSFILPGRSGSSNNSQFVTMENPDKPKEMAPKRPTSGAPDGEASDGSEDEEVDEFGDPVEQPQQEPEKKKVSPFGLFRR